MLDIGRGLSINMPKMPVKKAETPAAPAAAPAVTSTTGAGQQLQSYDKYTQTGMGATPAETMQRAQAAAAQTAQTASDQAIRQAVKAGKTAGAMGGQAALGAQGQAADAYSKGLESGTAQYYDTTKLGASLGSEMSNRLARGEQVASGEKVAKMQTDAQLQAAKMQAAAQVEAAKKQANAQLISGGIGALGGIASLFSDRNLKEDIKPDNLTEGLDAIKGYLYKYKGSDRPEAGVMAQDLEKTKMAPAVMNTPAGKMVDTRRLTTMNTGALAEHEARLKKIEGLVKALGDVPAPRKA